jgi:hypothetical protein
VNGTLVASTPSASRAVDVARARIGGRVKGSKGYYFGGGISSIALALPLRASE